MRRYALHFILCMMLALQGLPMMPIAQAHSPCPAKVSQAAMSMHATKAMPCHHQMAAPLAATGRHNSVMHPPVVHQHTCTSNCSSPCQLNVPVALASVVALALPRLFVVRSLEPHPLQVDNSQNSIQRPPIA